MGLALNNLKRVGMRLNKETKLLFLAAIGFSLLFFMYSSNICIDASTLSSILANPLPPSFLDTYSLCHLSDVTAYASLVFLSSGQLFEVLPSSTSRMVPSILLGGQRRCLTL